MSTGEPVTVFVATGKRFSSLTPSVVRRPIGTVTSWAHVSIQVALPGLSDTLGTGSLREEYTVLSRIICTGWVGLD